MKNKQVKNPVRSSQWQRLRRLLFAALCFVLLTWMAFNTSFQGHHMLYQQGYHSAKSLSQQLALTAALPLEQNNKPRLGELTNQLSSDAVIQSAVIYDMYGTAQAQSEAYSPYQASLGITQATPGISKLTQPIVVPINSPQDNKPIGFARVNYLPQTAIDTSHRYIHEVGRQVLLMLFICCIFTWQLGRGLKRWQLKRYFRKKAKQFK
ncbi:AhpA/YtjB family protein [Pseudoalteromonas sp. BDTF-M6]|uniref:AhpA/YtjB family protein n=1 Tax=Pseudoalteromonas sp. BDTF-M6 TaxID=2796132 RepID=UPI001BB06C16|nr:AhpA/YtjB family protein [Pseudoalteromonas sp. BDTF-M6]MBS3798169.1 smp protein [Pseudoalteromonas sp. BDTF-M6]